jgi:hypothetical protein
MLEVIKELIPLLDGAKTGAIWLIAAYLGLLVLQIFAYATCFAFLVWAAKEVITYGIRMGTSDAVNRNIHHVRFEYDGRKAELMVTNDVLAQLMTEIVAPNRLYIDNSDIVEATATLRKAKQK